VSTSTLHPPENMSAEYAEVVTTLRVYRLEDGAFDPHEWDDRPWQVDGFDKATGRMSSAVENYNTFQEAIAALGGFLDRSGYEWRTGPDCSVCGEQIRDDDMWAERGESPRCSGCIHNAERSGGN
jgi:hypothetical protein